MVQRGRAVAGYGTRVGIPGWVIPGCTRVGNTGYPATARQGAEPVTSGAGPGSPLQGDWSGWVTGAGTVPSACHPAVRPSPRTTHSGPCRPSGARSAVLGLSSGKRRDSTSFPVKLVKTPKCRQKVSKRPVMLPILKTGSESHLLKFPENGFG